MLFWKMYLDTYVIMHDISAGFIPCMFHLIFLKQNSKKRLHVCFLGFDYINTGVCIFVYMKTVSAHLIPLS